jgi:hypothetical protein
MTLIEKELFNFADYELIFFPDNNVIGEFVEGLGPIIEDLSWIDKEMYDVTSLEELRAAAESALRKHLQEVHVKMKAFRFLKLINILITGN